MEHDENTLRLNILALPNQQKVIVVMLALVVLGTLLAIGYNAPQSLFLALAGLLLALSFRQVLANFEADVRELGLRQAGDQFAALQERIAVLSRERLRLKPAPKLAIAERADGIQVVATWGRWYVAVGRELAQRLLAALAQPEQQQVVDFLLLHELYHLKHRDTIWLQYARALLHVGVRLILWFALLLIALVVLLSFVQTSFFANATPATIRALGDVWLPGNGENVLTLLFGSAEEYERVAAQARATDFGQVLFNVIANTLPFILLCSLLLTIYWQRLLRLREFYADAGATQVVGDAGLLIKAFRLTIASAPEARDGALGQLRHRWMWLNTWLNRTHPKLPERVALLAKPELANSSALAYGITIGLYVLGLNLIMSSTSALFLVGSWPMHFPVIAATVLIGLYLLTPIVLGQPVARPLCVTLLCVVALHGGMIVLSLALLAVLAVFDPALLQSVLESSARNLAWYTRIDPSTVAGDAATLLVTAAGVNLVQIPLVLLVSAGSLSLIAHLARRMLCWYGLPNAEHALMRSIYAMIGAVSALVALVILPPITDIALLRFNEPYSWASPTYWLGVVAILALTAFLGWRFITLDRQYAHRCPACASRVADKFALGRRCPHCDTLLHHWLGASYAFTTRPHWPKREGQQ